MNREDLRLIGYGKFASTCIETGTVDVQKMLNFTDGVLFGFDLRVRNEREAIRCEPTRRIPFWNEDKLEIK